MIEKVIEPDVSVDESILQDIKKACDSSKLDGKPLVKKISILLNLRIKNEVRILKIIDEGLIFDNEGVETVSDKAVALHKASKDSISDLVKVKQLLEGLPTDRSKVDIGLKELVEYVGKDRSRQNSNNRVAEISDN